MLADACSQTSTCTHFLHGKLPLLGLRGLLISPAVATPADWNPSQRDSSNNGLVAQHSCSMKEYWPKYGASGHRPALANTHLHTPPWAKLVFERWTIRAWCRATGHRRSWIFNEVRNRKKEWIFYVQILLCNYWWIPAMLYILLVRLLCPSFLC